MRDAGVRRGVAAVRLPAGAPRPPALVALVAFFALAAQTLALLAVLAAAPASAQTLTGRVLDESRESPVPGALVRLLDRDGEQRLQALTDSAGRFVLAPPEDGEFYLEVTGLGYRRTTFPLLSLTAGPGRRALELLVAPAPMGLEGLSVEVDPVTKAITDLELLGIDPADLGTSWITQAEIDAIEIKRDVGVILEWQQIGGLRVVRPENVPDKRTFVESLGMCISLVRGRTWQGVNLCALAVVDGIPITNLHLVDLDPLTVAAIAVLQPIEALTLYGKRAEGGAVLIWTRGGGGL